MAEKRTITIKQVEDKPWQKPDSETFWHTVVIDEYPSEPLKFIQDKTKGAPAPEVGKQYTGNVYSDEKGIKFYPFTNRGGGNRQPRDDASIKAQFAIKVAAHTVPLPQAAEMNESWFESVENAANRFFAMVDRVKESGK